MCTHSFFHEGNGKELLASTQKYKSCYLIVYIFYNIVKTKGHTTHPSYFKIIFSRREYDGQAVYP